MSLFRLLNRRTATHLTRIIHPHSHPPPLQLLLTRTFSFSSAEEAAAERRRRKRRLRIEPPLHALRRDPSLPCPPPDPNAKPLPDTTSSLTGPRLSLHNRVQSLIRAGDLDNAAAIARDSVFSRTRPTVFTCNALVASMYRAGRFDDAVSLFDYFFRQNNIVPNIVSYNFLIITHCDCGRVDVARDVYNTILADAPFGPSSVTFRHLTKGFVEAGRIGDAVDMLREMLNKGLGADSIVYNNLIKGYLDLGDLEKANELFDELKERCLVYDGVVNATFMEWFFVQGRGKEAMESYLGLLDREFRMTPVTCNVLLEVLLKHGKKKEAWELFDTMLDNHTTPTFQAVNSESFSIMANECFKEGKYDEAVATFRKVGTKMGSRPFVMDVAGYTNMIVRFTEHGMLGEAEKFYNKLQTKSLSHDVTAYRALIDAYLKEKRIDDALGVFKRMVDVKLRVLPLYANRWFTELLENNNNKAVACAAMLTKMGNAEVKPDALTYEIVIKGLVGVGRFNLAADMVGQAMGYGAGVSPLLGEFLLQVFEKEGRKEEMEKLLDEKRLGCWKDFGPPRPVGRVWETMGH
ncbi:pentatricopeptide repeat-containing protein At1g10270-like [Silene latifolia]|uniref:pentatricopeptide repeat-containing protein At1g10270-like n=1 Tax=Silene latifolia TaxID=37657 RepID=UPI003D77F3E7